MLNYEKAFNSSFGSEVETFTTREDRDPVVVSFFLCAASTRPLDVHYYKRNYGNIWRIIFVSDVRVCDSWIHTLGGCLSSFLFLFATDSLYTIIPIISRLCNNSSARCAPCRCCCPPKQKSSNAIPSIANTFVLKALSCPSSARRQQATAPPAAPSLPPPITAPNPPSARALSPTSCLFG